LIAHERELAAAGDYVAEAIAGFPLLVIRAKDGRLSAFHNVCRHRAGPLVEDGAGTCAALRCRYHGWLYEMDGRLAKRPGFAGDDSFDGAALSLFPVKVESWKGFVFVNLDRQAGPLLDGLGDLATATEGMLIERYAFHKRHAYDLPFNWKTYTDNYLEGYHIPLMHKGLAADLDMPSYRVENGRRVSIHRAHPKGGGAYDGLFLWRWPNNTLGVYGAGFNIGRILPLSHEKVRLTFDFYFDPAAGLTGEAKDRAAATTSAVVEEDFPMCESVQRNLAAGVYTSGPLSPRHEAGVAYFHDLVRQALA
jgi:choline monooxygenase